MKKILALLLSALLCMSMTACGESPEGDGKEKEEKNAAERLNIAMQLVPGFMPCYVMRDNGWLEEELKEAGYNVEVTYTEFESGPSENEAFAAGTQDIGVIGNVPGITAIAAGQERDIIGISYNGEKTIGILVPTDSDIQDISKLKGKKVGLVIGSIAQDYLNEMLKTAGLSLKDVELVNLGVSELETALAAKQVDAVAIWNPTMLKVSANKTGKLLADGTGVYTAENVIVANREYKEQNPEIVRIFMEQYQRAVDELLNHLDKYAERYAKETGLSAELLKRTWEDCNFPVILTEENQNELEKTAKFLYEQKLIRTEVKIEDYLDYSFSEGK